MGSAKNRDELDRRVKQGLHLMGGENRKTIEDTSKNSVLLRTSPDF